MKDILNIIFLIVATITPSGTVFAYGYGDLGSWSNPLYLEIQQDPLQQSRDEMEKLMQVVDTPVQNVTGCSATYDAIKTYKSGIWSQDVGDPYKARSASNYLKYLYSMHNSCVSRSQQDTQKLDQNCKNDLGVYGKLMSVDTVSRKYSCECQTGYQISNNYCVPIVHNDPPVKTTDMVSGCTTTVGFSSTTGIPCDGTNRCSVGMRFNSDKTACVVVPVVTPKTNDQICQESWKNTKWDGTKNDEGGLICDCKTGYGWNEGQTACVVVPKKEAKRIVPSDEDVQGNIVADTPRNTEEEIKPRGAFSRFLGWLFRKPSY